MHVVGWYVVGEIRSYQKDAPLYYVWFSLPAFEFWWSILFWISGLNSLGTRQDQTKPRLSSP